MSTINSTVKITVIDQHSPIEHMIVFGERLRVIGIEAEDNVILSVDDFNTDVVMERIGFTVIALFLIISGSGIFILNLRVYRGK